MSNEPHVNLILVCSSGFGNTEADDSDISHLYVSFRDKYQGVFPRGEIILRAWDTKWKNLARRLHRHAVKNCPTIFVGHSYGCGHGFRRFEDEWRKCGRQVDLAVLIDPVPRVFRAFIVGNIWSLTRWGTFEANARKVFTARQVNNVPMGRRVVLGMPHVQTIIRRTYGSEKKLAKYAKRAHPGETVVDPDVKHSTIDGLPEVQALLHEQVEAYITAIMEAT